MCTSVLFKCKDTYFGRNLDLERSYGECVVVTPRYYEFSLCCMEKMKSHYAMIGMAAIFNDVPLYYEATNEIGLSMAGLNFPGNAVYYASDPEKANIAPFELIPWILGQCRSVDEAKELLDKTNIVDIAFSEQLPLTPLHWMISDKEKSIVVESLKDGVKIYENPFDVLTNNPTFDYHKVHMSNYMGLHVGALESKFHPNVPVNNYSLGMGALGLPGDFSSVSRFVRTFFVKENSVTDHQEKACVHQFFHILNSAAMPKGCVWTANGYEYTRYSSCCNVNKGIYYYTTYDRFEILSIDMHGVDLNGSDLHVYDI